MCDSGSMARRVAAVVVLVSSVALAPTTGGCRQIAGIQDRSVPERCAPAWDADATCGECSEANCCTELSVCAADAACAEAAKCIAGCKLDDDACVSACANKNASGVDDKLAGLLACRTNACAEACHSRCGAEPTPSAACATCLDGKCCDAARACSADAACLTRRFRRAKCTDGSCRTLSDQRNPDGKAVDDALSACRRTHCSEACASWACASETPPPGSGRVTITLLTQDSLTPVPVPDLDVRMCGRGDAACSLGGPTATTNGSGVARFEVDIGKNGEDNSYFEVTDRTGARVPVLVFAHPSIRTNRIIGVPSLKRSARDDVLQALRPDLPPASPTILAHSLDCQREEAAGVKLELAPAQPGATEFYLDRRLPVVAANDSATDADLAFGGFVGVLPNPTTLRGRSPATRMELQFDSSVYVRPDTITFVEFAPRP